MEEKLNNLKEKFFSEMHSAKDTDAVWEVEVRYLGRKGVLTEWLRGIKDAPESDRPRLGGAGNRIKKEMERAVAEALAKHAKISASDNFDYTLPGTPLPEGHLHLVSEAIQEISDIFQRIGFVRVSYPEVEWDYYAFESLNMPKGHPARDEWETFFIDNGKGEIETSSGKLGKMVLTPHTSSGQVREMEKRKPPIRMMNIAKCYRRQIDVSHVPMFHQFEGLLVDKDISITHLKGVLDFFVKEFFGPERKFRIRPFHFQFTEPSFEVDISCGVCGGTGRLSGEEVCRLCKEGWLELGGAGMVHPNVLRAGGVDPKKYSGFAFGWGIERSYMMKSGLRLPDIRVLYQNDLRFLQQF